MKLRDKLNTEERYLENISFYKESIEEWYTDIEKLNDSEHKGIQLNPRNSNINAIKSSYEDIYSWQISILLSTYSVGMEISEVKREYLTTVNALVNSGWNPNNNYTGMIWLLSIGIMFDIEDNHFTKLVKLVELSNPKDFLMDFLIHSRIRSWERKSEKFLWNRPYGFLEQVISLAQSGNLQQAKTLLLEYLKKKWYRGCSGEAWYNSHVVTEESKSFPHDGYWSFESGALVKILGLDDSDWQDLPYYPYDMVHYK